MYQGIDVSENQGKIYWKKVKASGVQFVIFRAGMGKSTLDARFTEYINGAISVGLHIGIYWFMYATDREYARKNALKCIEVIAPYKNKIDMGVWCDWEGDSDRYIVERKHLPAISDEERLARISIFCDTMIAAGYPCGIYINQYYLQFFGKTNYPVWYAKNGSQSSHDSQKRCDIMWQYSASDGVNGIASARVDKDYYYGTLPMSDNPYPVPTRTIKQETPTMYGLDVAWMQTELNRHGYGLVVDGKAGKKSIAALTDYQSKHGLEVDGKCGKKTRVSLLENK